MQRSNQPKTPVTPVLDRLVDRSSGGRAMRDLRDVVRLDVENLLNTRWRFMACAEELTELKLSLVNYGIPDFTGAAFADPVSQREFCRIIENAIKAYEPRLRMASVKLRGGVPEDRIIRFRIEAMLQHGDFAERTVYESELDASTSTFRVGVSAA